MNLQRRSFILGASSLAFVLPMTSISARTQTSPGQAHKLLLVRENDLPESAYFAQPWRSLDMRSMEFQGDISSLLYERLVPIWRQSGTATAGLTNVCAFFCLSQVAADHGLRVIYRGVHRRVDNVVHHDIQGAQLVVASDAADWPSQVASAAEQTLCDATQRQALSIHDVLPGNEEAFISWVMIPRSALLA